MHEPAKQMPVRDGRWKTIHFNFERNIMLRSNKRRPWTLAERRRIGNQVRAAHARRREAAEKAREAVSFPFNSIAGMKGKSIKPGHDPELNSVLGPTTVQASAIARQMIDTMNKDERRELAGYLIGTF